MAKGKMLRFVRKNKTRIIIRFIPKKPKRTMIHVFDKKFYDFFIFAGDGEIRSFGDDRKQMVVHFDR